MQHLTQRILGQASRQPSDLPIHILGLLEHCLEVYGPDFLVQPLLFVFLPEPPLLPQAYAILNLLAYSLMVGEVNLRQSQRLLVDHATLLLAIQHSVSLPQPIELTQQLFVVAAERKEPSVHHNLGQSHQRVLQAGHYRFSNMLSKLLVFLDGGVFGLGHHILQLVTGCQRLHKRLLILDFNLKPRHDLVEVVQVVDLLLPFHELLLDQLQVVDLTDILFDAVALRT